jgi:hypothetical protein
MRGEEQMALVKPETCVREVLQEMTRRRAGAAVAVDEQGGSAASSPMAISLGTMPQIRSSATGPWPIS